ncbi:hypothetical protein [Halobaculum lipolyticum]|uniref:Small CPxCG-related zinc finger protein n=1 Tax=Halobaculum lipolyticum TaxID=3032001 RepID=A0ABD5W5F1_9EURY|nr:hypothetical protein [Halobaculum sp. DT31]
MNEPAVEVTCPDCGATHPLERTDTRVHCECGVELAVTVTRIR